MTDFSGDFLVPASQYVPGEIIVLDWAKCRVLINKQNINNLIDMTCTRSADISAGKAEINFKDPDKTLYSQINPGDEVEIYLSEQAPMTYGNKVWGGTVESRNYDIENKKLLVVNAKEYTQTLIAKITDSTAINLKNDFTNVEPGTIIQALMPAYQVEYTSDNVLTGTTSLMTATFLKKTLFDCLKQICDTYAYVFYINLLSDLVVRKSSTMVNTPPSDYLLWGDNLIKCNEEENKEFMVNSVVVTGKTSSITATYSDQNSIDTYGKQGKSIIAPSLSTNTDCLNYATAYVNAFKDPLPCIKTSSRLIAFSEPLEYIQLTSAPNVLDGVYQIREITHQFGKTGIQTDLTLSNKISDLSISLGQFLSRLSSVETKSFS
jgi:hypothetical protein